MFENAKLVFDKFISDNFDIDNDKISLRLTHTYNVVKMAEYICKDLNLEDEDICLAKTIALLHDIGRFDQAKEFNSFREDIINYDHASLGVKLLFDDNFIREFVADDKYDDIIKVAIANHSKYKLEEDNLDDRKLLHCKLIRDADKIDSFRNKMVTDIYTIANITEDEVENSIITDKIYNDFMAKKTILSKDRKTGIDIWISYIAFIFDFNFVSGLKYIKDKNYINILIDKFDYKNEDIKIKMENIRKFANDYIDERIKENR